MGDIYFLKGRKIQTDQASKVSSSDRQTNECRVQTSKTTVIFLLLSCCFPCSLLSFRSFKCHLRYLLSLTQSTLLYSTLIPNPSPSRIIIGNGLGALEYLSPADGAAGGRFGSGAEGGGAGGPKPTTGIPKSRAGREVRGFAGILLVVVVLL